MAKPCSAWPPRYARDDRRKSTRQPAGSPECAEFFRKVHDADKAQLAEAKRHLVAVLNGTMGAGNA